MHTVVAAYSDWTLLDPRKAVSMVITPGQHTTSNQRPPPKSPGESQVPANRDKHSLRRKWTCHNGRVSHRNSCLCLSTSLPAANPYGLGTDQILHKVSYIRWSLSYVVDLDLDTKLAVMYSRAIYLAQHISVRSRCIILGDNVTLAHLDVAYYRTLGRSVWSCRPEDG